MPMVSTARRNRVDPFGELIADPSRGTLFGNRGVLHDEHGEVRRHHAGKRWIYCRLEFKGMRRELMKPGQFTGLFFLDEPTALAAEPVKVPAMDEVLHRERVNGSGGKRTHEARLADLPSGVMVLTGREPTPHLLDSGRLQPWSFSGYGPASDAGSGEQIVEVLTPASIVRALAAGFTPDRHGV